MVGFRGFLNPKASESFWWILVGANLVNYQDGLILGVWMIWFLDLDGQILGFGPSPSGLNPKP